MCFFSGVYAQIENDQNYSVIASSGFFFKDKSQSRSYFGVNLNLKTKKDWCQLTVSYNYKFLDAMKYFSTHIHANSIKTGVLFTGRINNIGFSAGPAVVFLYEGIYSPTLTYNYLGFGICPEARVFYSFKKIEVGGMFGNSFTIGRARKYNFTQNTVDLYNATEWMENIGIYFGYKF